MGGRAELECFADAGPRRRRPRWRETAGPDGWRTVGDTEKPTDLSVLDTRDDPSVGLDSSFHDLAAQALGVAIFDVSILPVTALAPAGGAVAAFGICG